MKKKKIIKLLFYSITISFLIPIFTFIIMWVVGNFFGPHYIAPVDNEEWLWNLTGTGGAFIIITEVLVWTISLYKLMKLFRK